MYRYNYTRNVVVCSWHDGVYAGTHYSNMLSFIYDIAKMSTNSLMGKYQGSRISIDSVIGTHLGYRVYVLFALTHHPPIQRC